MKKAITLTLITAATAGLTVLYGCNKTDESASANNKGAEQAAESEVPTVPVVTVQSKILDRKFSLPGELEAFLNVPIHAKVKGYITDVLVDRGSVVKKGQVLIRIMAPELDAKVKECEAKLSAARSSYREAQSKLESDKATLIESQTRQAADELTFQRLLKAAKVPGAVAQNEVDMSGKACEGDKARVESIKSKVAASEALVAAEKDTVVATQNELSSEKEMTKYLTITAPFNGVITERNVHPGSIVAIDSGRESVQVPLLRIQEKSKLRLVVSVPEAAVAGVKDGTPISFTVPSYLGETFTGVVRRIGYALDVHTRTMPVELDVDNRDGRLEPGMFATVTWESHRSYPTMFLPDSAIAQSILHTFVVKVNDGKAQVVEVQRGQPMEDLVEVVGDIKPGDEVLLKASDEFSDGQKLIAKAATEADIRQAEHQSSSGGGE